MKKQHEWTYRIFTFVFAFLMINPLISQTISSKHETLITKLLIHESQRDQWIPKAVNNSHEVYYPWPFYQTGLECGQSTSISQILNYEICFLRGWTDINYNLDHKFPAHFVWNFCNDGINQGVLFLESWKVVHCAGTPNFTDWGGYPQEGQHRKWISGYDKYYRSMQNRISEVCEIPTDSEWGILTLKHWLYNHIDNQNVGGLANFNATFKYPDQTIPNGLPEAGKSIITHFTNDPNHAYTIIGYNDTVGWDFNQDHQLTNHLDINGDGKVNIQDWEIGCFIISHTSGPSWGDFGQTYLPYRLMSQNYHNGGIWGTSAYIVKVKEAVHPQLTAKLDITYNKRGRIKIYFGVSSDTSATEPTSLFTPYIFDYQGGDFYMTGGDAESDQTIEVGVDISPLLNQIEPNTPQKFFLLIDEQDPDQSGYGQINHFSIIHYSDIDTLEIHSGIHNQSIVQNGTTSASLVYGVPFTKPEIKDSVLQITVNEPFKKQLSAIGGIPNYRWELSKGYQPYSIPNQYISSDTRLVFTDPDTGFVKIELPFSFPYFGEPCNTLYLSADGFISFSVLDYYPFVYSNRIKFETTKMIAPFFADLIVLNAGKRYDEDKLMITFQAQIKNQPYSSISFSVQIDRDGYIDFNFNKLIFSGSNFISGVSDGNISNFFYHSFSKSTAAELSRKSIRYKPIIPQSSIYLSATGVLSGLITKPQQDSVFVSCYDNNEISTHKWITLESINPNHLTVSELSMAFSDCNQMQRGGSDYLNLTVTNYGDSAYFNPIIDFYCDSPYLILSETMLELGSFSAFETQTYQQAIPIHAYTHAPENHPIDIRWFLVSNGDTLSEGIYTITIYIPDIKLIHYEFSTINVTEKKATFHLKNLKNCFCKNITVELVPQNDQITITSSHSDYEISPFGLNTVPFHLDDPYYILQNTEQEFILNIYENGQFIQSEQIQFSPHFYYSAFPNPTSNHIELISSDPLLKILNASVFNIHGELVTTVAFHSNPYIIDLSAFAQGVYFIQVKSDHQNSKTIKIIKL